MVRVRRDAVEHLVLSDSPVVVRSSSGRVTVHNDDRVDRLTGYSLEAARRARNQPGGFWVASTQPEAAYEAITGTTDRREVDAIAVLSDGVSRYAERYGHTWEDLMDVLTGEGPRVLVERVWAYDEAAPASSFRGKRYDDATAVLAML
jgi:hypothetical protein